MLHIHECHACLIFSIRENLQVALAVSGHVSQLSAQFMSLSPRVPHCGMDVGGIFS